MREARLGDYRDELLFVLSTIPYPRGFEAQKREQDRIARLITEAGPCDSFFSRFVLQMKVRRARRAYENVRKQLESEYHATLKRPAKPDRIQFLLRVHTHVCFFCDSPMEHKRAGGARKTPIYDYQQCPKCHRKMSVDYSRHNSQRFVPMPDGTVDDWLNGSRVASSGKRWRDGLAEDTTTQKKERLIDQSMTIETGIKSQPLYIYSVRLSGRRLEDYWWH